jgi:hypothetical protein
MRIHLQILKIRVGPTRPRSDPPDAETKHLVHVRIQRFETATAIYERMLGPMQPLIATLECVFDATVIGEEPAGG